MYKSITEDAFIQALKQQQNFKSKFNSKAKLFFVKNLFVKRKWGKKLQPKKNRYLDSELAREILTADT